MDLRYKAMEAWKRFVATGEVEPGTVRPEIEASWRRCREAGLSPWGTSFADCNVSLLKEKAHRFRRSIDAVQPVAQVLMALCDCNVSLVDWESFVFYLVTPYSDYPRTIGTFMHEDELGTGNATIVAQEHKPVRCDGFEHYRVASQNYSGVSVPYLDRHGHYLGAMNLNQPFEPLPACALDLCQVGVEMSQKIFLAKDRAEQMLASAEFFAPMLMLYDFPVAILDEDGHLLSANAAMDQLCPGWEKLPYGSVSIGEYMAKPVKVSDVIKPSRDAQDRIDIKFRKRGAKTVHEATLLRRSLVTFGNNPPFLVCVFSQKAPAVADAPAPRIPLRTTRRPAFVPDTVDYIGESPQWIAIDQMVSRVAPIAANVLVLGETGTGKEMVARAIHRRSGRTGQFVSINCGALPRDLLATELFGYEGGAFTGAKEGGAIGKFEYADGGTLFLDEIGEMPIDMQVSLLRFLQDRTVTRLGSNDVKQVDVRIVAATNQDLQQLIERKQFRADLYFRLSLIEMPLPPLRTREGDVALLAEYFNKQASEMLQLPYSPLPREVSSSLKAYSWPGNVRELRNVVERCLILAGEGDKVTLDMLPQHFRKFSHKEGAKKGDVGFLTFSVPYAYGQGAADAASSSGAVGTAFVPEEAMASWDKDMLLNLLRKNDGDLLGASRELGITADVLIACMGRVGLKIHTTAE